MRLTEKIKETYWTNQDNCALDYVEQDKIVCGGRVLNKLGQLEDIEEELGIDLITLLKALKNGIFMNSPFDVVFCKYPKLVCYKNGWRLMANGSAFSLNNYGKYWALTKEELL